MYLLVFVFVFFGLPHLFDPVPSDIFAVWGPTGMRFFDFQLLVLLSGWALTSLLKDMSSEN